MISIFDDFAFYLQRFITMTTIIFIPSFIVSYFITSPSYLLSYTKFTGLVLCIIGFIHSSSSSSNQSHSLAGSSSYYSPHSNSASNHNPRVNATGTADFDSGVTSYMVYGGGMVFLVFFILDFVL